MSGPIDWTHLVTRDPESELEAARAAARARILAWIDTSLAPLTAGVPLAERQGWPVKAERARAHLDGMPDPAILLEARAGNEDPDALARHILTKADHFALVVATTTGLRRATERAIAGAGSPAALDAVLARALERAQQMMHELGLTGTG